MWIINKIFPVPIFLKTHMAILAPSFCAFLALILLTGGLADTNLGPTQMVNMDAGGLDLANNLINTDYDYQCQANLGPCNYEYCNMDCCIKQCRSYYNGLHPRPYCEDWGPEYKYKLCICWHDCYKK
ncbi:uncharacterized protein LOC132602075 [Lycium barbarum]|uniref:uncharacterized protein LOC132602075 n=1 Tax=Lycium barbarum TaxID=112863 RepID=UPI00293E0CEF|nr:uncharacterized protein LOC132602075 [Lycium barbarum]